MMNATHEIPCYTPNELTTVHMVVTTAEKTHKIKGFLLGVQKEGFRYHNKTLENAGDVNKTNNLCDDYVTFSHSALLSTKKIEFKFNFTSKERVELRSTVVFSYSDVINNRSYYFDACPTPTPSSTPSPSPAPSSPSPSVAAPSVTPTPSCPSYTATQIANFKCPYQRQAKIHKLTKDVDCHGIKYTCVAKIKSKYYIFPTSCWLTDTFSTEDYPVCHVRLISMRNCRISLYQRKRKFNCTAKNNPQHTIKLIMRVGIEKFSSYTCDVTVH
ncbi:PREDICTED: uncharacterized protein LOC109587222 [Amphimedon queenslandica]|uniref:Uncharacterized protein n=1 Tax=Amphimedon queenslandica TaxID=400682 RepID=A0AAN0JPR7_AMPQE|nr:PREDICTED: uncharacterized protein LOC109587222 [Amphimedon queenslandica]|eukprot:XP_019859021.1 PREDICTED: uncharacterized protein LOC109587222 [Amphimedon queenslandica]